MDARQARKRLETQCLGAGVFFEELRLLQAVMSLGMRHEALVVVEATRAQLRGELGWHANTITRYMKALSERALPWLKLASSSKGYRILIALDGSAPSFFAARRAEQHKLGTNTEHAQHRTSTGSEQGQHKLGTSSAQAQHKHSTSAAQAQHTGSTSTAHGTVDATRPPAIQFSSLRSENISCRLPSERAGAPAPAHARGVQPKLPAVDLSHLPMPRLPELPRRAVTTPPAQPETRAELPVVFSPEPSVEEVQVVAPVPVREETPATVETGEAAPVAPVAPCEAVEADDGEGASAPSPLTAYIIAQMAQHGHEVREDEAGRVELALWEHCASEDEARRFVAWKVEDLDGRVGATRAWLSALSSKGDVMRWRSRSQNTTTARRDQRSAPRRTERSTSSSQTHGGRERRPERTHRTPDRTQRQPAAKEDHTPYALVNPALLDWCRENGIDPAEYGIPEGAEVVR